MDRRGFLTGLIVGAAVGLVPLSALAQDVAAPVLRVLTKQGYGDFKIKRTWLGRLQIIAESDGRRREVVLNNNTGEVLRDVVYLDGKSTSGFADEDQSETGGHAVSSGKGSGGDLKDDSSASGGGEGSRGGDGGDGD